MKRHRFLLPTVATALLFLGLNSLTFAADSTTKKLDEDQMAQADCVGCHINVNPGIVKQHMEGPHANTKKVEDEVRCHDCHGVDHKTMDDVEK
ncbi:MAG: multiheme c-type cytochrome, partial [Candidatus Thiodiazotropha sp.]